MCLRNGRHIRTIENEKLRYMQIPTRGQVPSGDIARDPSASLGMTRGEHLLSPCCFPGRDGDLWSSLLCNYEEILQKDEYIVDIM